MDFPIDDETRARFWAKVQKTAGPASCWEWTGSKSRRGYGFFWVHPKMQQAHRVSRAMACGPIPEGLLVRHGCDNPSCVRPSHLSVGTHQDNMDDAVERGRFSVVLPAADVLTIRASTASSRALAARFGVSRALIRGIKDRTKRSIVSDCSTDAHSA